ncbi:ABC transporter ATP-binding protein [Sphingosinicella sp. BN140058]|uniref:ATP-binding cassette domain-containing protein n=1 Tax=Sphingosinicella sp. BN140058 TaxID=1892855 RepID=UPI001FB0730B|nr:ABC transporter ATP-binding protein [Sphingosinicella sp. BN140058]
MVKAHGRRRVLDRVSLSLPAGAFVALVGPSGSGKTTLLKTINRLIEPDEGVVRIEGADVRDMPAPLLRRGIGYAFQGIGLFPHRNVAENIATVPRLLGWSEDERAARVSELLALVALPAEFASRMPHTLSGGQAQRVGIARALAARPSLMLMDEPFGALDPITRDALGRAYRALHAQLGLTTIMVTHDITEALLLADRIVVLLDGAVRADATPAALLRGHADADVAALIALPRAQARRLADLADPR